MNVLMVASSYPKFPGDTTAPFIESIAHAVAARGHRVDVLLPHHPDLRRPAGEPVRVIEYHYAPREDWSLWGYAQSLQSDVRVRRGVYLLAPLVALALRRALGAELAARRYDVVHAHWVVPNAAMVTDIVAAHRVPFVVSTHGSDIFLAERSGVIGALARSALGAAGRVTACSEDLRRRAIALGSAPGRTRTVPYGVDAAAFGGNGTTTEPEARSALRARLGAPNGTALVLAVGRLVEKKGFGTLVEAAAGLSDAHVAIAGAGDLRGPLEQRIAELRAPVRLAGALDRDDVAAAMAAADVVAVPSVVDAAGNVDGLPNTLLEAMAAGRAVVASRVAGIPDVITDGVNGVLVRSGDAVALRSALAGLIADERLRARLGAAARKSVLARHGWDTAARRFEECYAEAAALDAG
jgi:glycosyltransferase involved in cell wall biosynthesis